MTVFFYHQVVTCCFYAYPATWVDLYIYERTGRFRGGAEIDTPFQKCLLFAHGAYWFFLNTCTNTCIKEFFMFSENTN